MEKQEGKRVLFSDIDGTLYRDSMLIDVMERLAVTGKLPQELLREADMMKRLWRAREVSYDDYLDVLIHWLDRGGLKGLSADIFNAEADALLKEKGRNVYVFTRELVAAAQKCGYDTAAISHSPIILVDAMARLWGFNVAHGVHYAVGSDGCFTNERMFSNKEESMRRLKEKHGWSDRENIAIGDTISDLSLLERVKYPIAFNPSRALERKARLSGIPVVKERKDTIEAWRERPVEDFFREARLQEILPRNVAETLSLSLLRLGYDIL